MICSNHLLCGATTTPCGSWLDDSQLKKDASLEDDHQRAGKLFVKPISLSLFNLYYNLYCIDISGCGPILVPVASEGFGSGSSTKHFMSRTSEFLMRGSWRLQQVNRLTPPKRNININLQTYKYFIYKPTNSWFFLCNSNSTARIQQELDGLWI